MKNLKIKRFRNKETGLFDFMIIDENGITNTDYSVEGYKKEIARKGYKSKTDRDNASRDSLHRLQEFFIKGKNERILREQESEEWYKEGQMKKFQETVIKKLDKIESFMSAKSK